MLRHLRPSLRGKALSVAVLRLFVFLHFARVYAGVFCRRDVAMELEQKLLTDESLTGLSALGWWLVWSVWIVALVLLMVQWD